MLLLATIAVASVCLGGLFSGLESATLALNRLSLQSERASRVNKVRDIYRILSRTQAIIFAARVGNCLAAVGAVLATNLIWVRVRRLASPAGLLDDLIVAAVVFPFFLLFAVLLPKRYFRKHPRSLILDVFRPLLLSFALFAPPMRAFGVLVQKVARARKKGSARPEKFTREDMKQILGEGDKSARHAAIDKRMIYGIFDLEQTIVREIMQPLVNIVALERREATPGRIFKLARESGFSKIPLYSRSIVNLDGIVDVLALLRAPEPRLMGQHTHQPYYVPETMRADKLMRKIITDKIDIAIVVDEFGGTVGLVTREDVLEEIVGEIEDEFDPARPTILPLPDGSYLVDGRMDIDNVNDRFELRLPNEDYDTLGGFIYDEVGRVPKVGDVIEKRKLRLEVMSMDGKQIERVKLYVASPSGTDDVTNPDDDAM